MKQLVREALAPLGLRPKHYGVLRVLAAVGPDEALSQQALGARLGIDRTTVVAVIDDLEGLGLAVRRVDPDDRRAHRIELTKPGRATLARADASVAAADDALLAPLARDERRQLHALLRRIAAEPPTGV